MTCENVGLCRPSGFPYTCARTCTCKGGTGNHAQPYIRWRQPLVSSPVAAGLGYQQAATLTPCPRCRRHVLTGRQYGSAVTADAGNISIAGELQARLQRRATYDLLPGDYPPRLYFRWRGVAEVRAVRQFAVVPDHVCGSAVLPSEPAPAYAGLPVPVRVVFPDRVPF